MAHHPGPPRRAPSKIGRRHTHCTDGPHPNRVRRRPRPVGVARGYFDSSALPSSFFCRLSQPYFFWNFSTRPVVSMNFILPVKNGCEALEMSSLTTGYSLPSVQTILSGVLTVERVRNEKLAAVSTNTTGRYSG